MLSQGQFGKAFKALKVNSPKEGGFTVDPFTGEAPRDGFMVSKGDDYKGEEMERPTSSLTPDSFDAEISDYVKRNQANLSEPGMHLGGWKPEGDPSETSVYIDSSRRVARNPAVARQYGKSVANADARTSALDLAIAHDQLAIYDLAKNRSIDTVRGGGRPSERG
jgi:hypothetical protein